MHPDDTGKPNRRTTSITLWKNVDRSGYCWERNVYRDKDGYTRVHPRPPHRILAHRAAWQEVTGEVLTKADIIGHVCDNPPCIRNDDEGWYEVKGILLPRRGHLFKATMAENNLDRDIKGHYSRAKLTAAQVIAIRTLAEQGVRMRDLARQYNVTYMTIWMITTRRAWQHI